MPDARTVWPIARRCSSSATAIWRGRATGQGEAEDHINQWLWIYNIDCPNIPFSVCKQTNSGQRGIAGITPAMKLKMAT